MPIVAIVSIVIFPPWAGIMAWLAPLPDTVREQVDGAIDYGLDGIIVYVDQSGNTPAFYFAGWKNKLTQVPAVVIQFVNTTGGERELVSKVVYNRIVQILRR